MTGLSDDALRALVRADPAAGWRAFIDQYTPLLVGLIRRAGLVDRDEVMEVYVVICEQLSARGCERLRSQDGARGSIGGWLAVVARHAVVDWVRSKKGRRRLFQAVKDLSRFDQRVFELYYWDERGPGEIAELLAPDTGGPDVAAVFDALGRLHTALNDRHRAELLALAARSKAPVAIDDTDAAERLEDPHDDPESRARVAQIDAALDAALRQLLPEDAAIVRLKFIEGLSNASIEHAIGITGLGPARIQQLLATLRTALARLGVDARDVADAHRLSFDRNLS